MSSTVTSEDLRIRKSWALRWRICYCCFAKSTQHQTTFQIFMWILTKTTLSLRGLEKPLIAVNGGECRDPRLYKILRIKDGWWLSPKQDFYTPPLELWKIERDRKCYLLSTPTLLVIMNDISCTCWATQVRAAYKYDMGEEGAHKTLPLTGVKKILGKKA